MQQSSTTVNSRLRDLLPAAFWLLVLVSVSSIIDVLVAGMSSNFGDIRWRYQLMQLVLTGGTQIGLVVALFMLLGTLADQRVTVRAAGGAAGVFGALYLVIIPFFALDFVVARRLIAVNVRHGFDVQTAKTAAYVGVLAVALLWSGIRAIRITPKPDAMRPREVGEGLVVGRA